MNSTPNKLYLHAIFILLLLAVGVFSWSYIDRGPLTSDPATYMYAAQQIASGHNPTTAPKNCFEPLFYERYLVTIPLAIGIKILGGVGRQLVFVSTVELLLLLFMLYGFLPTGIGLLAAMFVGLSPVVLTESGQILGDIVAALTVNLPVLLYYRYKYTSSPQPKSPILYGIITGVSLLLAYETKEYLVFFVPLFAVLIIADIATPLHRKFWLYTIGVAVSGFVLTLVYYKLVTGSAFYRFNVVGVNSVADRDGGFWQSVTIGPAQYLISLYGYGIGFFFAMVFVFAVRAQNSAERFFKIYLLVLMAVWWWGGKNPGWQMLPYTRRYWLPLIVPVMIAAAFALQKIATRSGAISKRWTLVIAIIFFLLMLTTPNTQAVPGTMSASLFSNYFMYAVVIGFVLVYLWRGHATMPWIIYTGSFSLVFVALFLRAWLFIQNDKILPHHYDRERAFINLFVQPLKPAPGKYILVNDQVAEHYRIYTGWNTPDIPFAGFSTVNSDTITPNNYLVIGNGMQENYTIGQFKNIRLLKDTLDHRLYIFKAAAPAI